MKSHEFGVGSVSQEPTRPDATRRRRERGADAGRVCRSCLRCRRGGAAARFDPARLHTISAISTDEVARVAALARVALSDEEVSRLAGELDAVASPFVRVTNVVTPDLPAASHPVPLTSMLREDVPAPTLDVDELLAGAPASEDSMFLVPQILGEDSAP